MAVVVKGLKCHFCGKALKKQHTDCPHCQANVKHITGAKDSPEVGVAEKGPWVITHPVAKIAIVGALLFFLGYPALVFGVMFLLGLFALIFVGVEAAMGPVVQSGIMLFLLWHIFWWVRKKFAFI